MKQRSRYSTAQIAKLYGIGIDSLYYYEQVGILVPERNPKNNYREYSDADMQALSIIREMLKLGFSTGEIKAYLDNKSLAKTTALFNEELSKVGERIFELMSVRNELESRLMTISRALSKSQSEEISVSEIPRRECIMIREGSIDYYSIEKEIIQYAASHGRTINTMAMADCYTVDIANFNKFNCYESKNVFLYSENGNYASNYELPAGKYITCTYRGFVWRSPQILPKMLQFARDNHLEVLNDPIEFCIVDEYESDNEDEYITRLEIPVVRVKPGVGTPRTDEMLSKALHTLERIQRSPPAIRER